MNVDEMKTAWQASSSFEKTQDEILMMTKVKNHPNLRRFRLKFAIEVFLLLGFLTFYYDMFDGHEKPIWVNIILVVSALLYVINDLVSWIILRNPIKENNLFESLSSFMETLKRMSVFSFIVSFLFGFSIIAFFSTAVDFSMSKYAMLIGMLLTLVGFMYISVRDWQRKIQQIGQVLEDFETQV